MRGAVEKKKKDYVTYWSQNKYASGSQLEKSWMRSILFEYIYISYVSREIGALIVNEDAF